MIKKACIIVVLIALAPSSFAQIICRKLVSSAGGTLTGEAGQITFSIGETIIPSLNTVNAMITQGFQQPGERIKTGSVSTKVFIGSSFNLPYTAIDIGEDNTFTVQLSNAAGSFESPVTIGTLSGNASTAEINVAIPANTAAGNEYRIRVVSNSTPYTGIDNGENITITQDSSLGLAVGKADEVHVSVYPNPSNDQFTLAIENNSNEKIDVVIYDVSGKILRQINKNKGEPIVFGKELPRGVYVAVISQGIHKKIIKLIKE